MLSLRYFLNNAPLSEVIEGSGLSIEIEVDGGINTETERLCVEAEASVLVASCAINNLNITLF